MPTAPESEKFETRALFANRYRIGRELGRGGMGVVLSAFDEGRAHPVALKLLKTSMERRDEVSRRFRREFRAIQRLEQSNIVRVYDYGIHGKQRYFTMQIVEGENLGARLGFSSEPPPATQLNSPERIRLLLIYFCQLCKALSAIHAHRIIHRDLKPSNILVQPNDQIVVMDFGLVRAVDDEASKLTQEGIVVGTIAYMSPEQAMGGRMDFRSDLYSAGVILYEALAGRRPFRDPSITGLLLKQVHEKPYPVSVYNPGVSPELEAVALKLLEKDPFKRYQSSEGLLQALQSIEAQSRTDKNGATQRTQALVVRQRPQLLPPRFIGRENELSSLRLRLHELRGGKGGVILIGGESGIGKSRMVEELRAEARLHEIHFLRGVCFEGNITPYAAFQTPMEKLAHQLSRRPKEEQRKVLWPEGQALLQLSPCFHDVREIRCQQPLESLSPGQERYRVFSAASKLLRSQARQKPIVLVLDDLQWADALSIDLLGHLVRNVINPATELDRPELAAPLLLLGTYRDDEIQEHPLQSLIRQLRRRRQLQDMVLQRLTLEQIGAFLQSMLAMETSPLRLARRVYTESEGNPFFVEEIMKSLLEEGVLQWGSSGWYLELPDEFDVSGSSSFHSYSQLPIPVTIQDVVNKRLERLDDETRGILSCAAVIGREFTFDLLLMVLGIDEDRLLDAIDQLLKHQVITERSDAEDHFDFYHSKLREVLYDHLRRRERVRYHRKIVEAAEGLYSGSIERHYEFLAHHAFVAGLQDKAIDYLYRAGIKLQKRYLNEEAIAHLRKALVILDAKGEAVTEEQAKTRLACYRTLVAALFHTGDASGALGTCQRMEASARAEKLETYVAWALLGQGQCHHRFANFESSSELTREALSLFHRHGELLGAATCHQYLGQIETIQSNFDSAANHHQRAKKLFEGLGAKQEVASVLGDIANNHYYQRQMPEAEGAFRESLEISRKLGDKTGMARFLGNLGVILVEQGDYRRALDHYAESIRLNQEVGNKANLAVCYQSYGAALVMSGIYDKALKACQQAIELSEEVEQRFYLCQALCNRGDLLLALGQLDQAGRDFSRSLEIAQDLDVPTLKAYALLNLARLAQTKGQDSEALALYSKAAEEGRSGNMERTLISAELRHLILDNSPTADPALIESLLDRSQISLSHVDQIEVAIDAARVMARIGHDNRAEELATHAAEASHSSGLLENQVLALGLLASLAEQNGATEKAILLAQRCLETIEELFDHVPADYHGSFLRRSDLQASVEMAAHLAQLPSAPRILELLVETFREQTLLLEHGNVPGETEAVQKIRGIEGLEPPTPPVASFDEEETGRIDYAKLGIFGPKQG